MSEQEFDVVEGQGLDPAPDPWIPPRANYAQAASIGTGATGVALLVSDQPSGTVDSVIAWLPDPARLFGGVAHVLGFQFDASSAWMWGLILVIVSLALNIYSYVARYRFAVWVKPRWDAQLARIKEHLRQQQAAPIRRQGSGGL
jgi:hypothetical protein